MRSEIDRLYQTPEIPKEINAMLRKYNVTFNELAFDCGFHPLLPGNYSLTALLLEPAQIAEEIKEIGDMKKTVDSVAMACAKVAKLETTHDITEWDTEVCERVIDTMGMSNIGPWVRTTFYAAIPLLLSHSGWETLGVTAHIRTGEDDDGDQVYVYEYTYDLEQDRAGKHYIVTDDGMRMKIDLIDIPLTEVGDDDSEDEDEQEYPDIGFEQEQIINRLRDGNMDVLEFTQYCLSMAIQNGEDLRVLGIINPESPGN